MVGLLPSLDALRLIDLVASSKEGLIVKFFALILVFFFGCAPICNAQSSESVSLVQLIANPERFDGKFVRVIGFMHLEFEGDSIYLHREDFERSISKNGLQIDVPESMAKEFYRLNDKYVLIEGVFSSKTGHMGLFSGSMEKLKRASDWSANRQDKAEKVISWPPGWGHSNRESRRLALKLIGLI